MIQVRWGRKGLKEILEALVQLGLLEPMARRVRRDRKVSKDPRDNRVIREYRVRLASHRRGLSERQLIRL